MAVFVHTVEAGSLAAAGKALGISAPMAGRHVRYLETHLGVRLLVRVNDVRALQQAARAGIGLICGPEPVLRPDIKSGDLIEVLADYSLPSRSLHILYASRYPTKTLRTFVETVLNAFGA